MAEGNGQSRFRYEEARDQIVAFISAERLTRGQRLPTERQLAETLGVSRPTLRQALELLEKDGLIERRQGSGTYVAEPRVAVDVRVLVSLTRSIVASGMRPGARVVTSEVIPATRQLAARFAVAPQTPLQHFQRVRYADDRIVAFERSWFPASIAPNLNAFDLEHRSIYDVLEREYGVKLLRAEQEFDASVADDKVAALLECEPGAPLMVVHRLSIDFSGQPVEYAVDRFLPLRSVFKSTALVP
ncbi:MAG TPA: GntR family transcriptional regulator [Candidatus Dormibacteraeota bacterium]|nr:GntR family transcriptional regulator [Candidatus Dormibacteraeota bacterium]